MYLFLLLISIIGGVFFVSELFMDSMNDPKHYFLLITSIIILISCISSKKGIQKLQITLQSHGLFLGLTAICFLSSLLGLLQYIGILTSYHDAFRITGSFENPAGFAVIQSCMFPFVFVNCFEKESGHLECFFSIVVSVFCLFTIILSGSRAGILSVCTAIAIVFAFQSKVKIYIQKHKWLWILLPIVMFSLLVFLYFIKPDSANGRWFIWGRSLEIIMKHPLFGNGPDGFHKLYMEQQAEYFSTHPNSPYIMIADNVRHPFNEYIKLTCQYGTIGLFFAIFLLALVVYKLFKCSERCKILGLSYVASVFVLCQFSYPFNYDVVWLFSFIALAQAFITSRLNLKIPILVRYVITPFLLVFLYLSVRQMYFEMKLKEVTVRTLNGKPRRMIKNFEDMDKILGGDPLFKYNYAVLLNNIGRYEESLAQVIKCEEKWNEYSTQMLFANIYKNLGQKENSIQAYKLAQNMVPCRFEPLYGQLMIYYDYRDTINIIRTAYEIIEKPIKVQSDRVSQIIAHANYAIETLSTD